MIRQLLLKWDHCSVNAFRIVRGRICWNVCFTHNQRQQQIVIANAKQYLHNRYQEYSHADTTEGQWTYNRMIREKKFTFWRLNERDYVIHRLWRSTSFSIGLKPIFWRNINFFARIETFRNSCVVNRKVVLTQDAVAILFVIRKNSELASI